MLYPTPPKKRKFDEFLVFPENNSGSYYHHISDIFLVPHFVDTPYKFYSLGRSVLKFFMGTFIVSIKDRG